MESINFQYKNTYPFQRLSLIIPCFNESSRLPIYLQSLSKSIPGIFEILIIDDGSSNAEFELLKNRLAPFLNDNIKLYHYAINKGKFNAIEYGIELSKYEYLGIVDADGSVPTYEVFSLWSYFNSNLDTELLVASREIDNNKVITYFSKRKIAHKIFIKLIKILFQVKVNDTQCGLKFIKKSSHDRLKKFMINKRWIWDTEIVILAELFEINIKEIGIDWSEMKGSKFHFFRDSLEILFNIYQFKKHIRTFQLS
ncbi:MAG: glycosyltransferase [Leptospiraceae bacterium]|nr:glycosyltransferase [Leptospiraceae bacterium]